MASKEDRPKIGLVLSSGGARGAAHIGVMRVLEEIQVPIDIIVGASMGAIVGGAYAAGVSLDELEAEWTGTSFFKLARNLLPSHSFKFWTDGEEILKLFSKIVGDVKIEHLKTPYAALTTDLRTGDPHVIRSGSLADAMRASSSIPIIFAPVEKEGHCLVDGGLTNPLPVNFAREMGADRVIAVDVNSRPKGLLDPEKHHGPSGKGDSTPDLMETVSAIMILVQRQLSKHIVEKHRADVYIEPDAYAGLFGYREGKELVATGESAARANEANLRALLRTEG